MSRVSKRTEDLEKDIAKLEAQLAAEEAAATNAILRLDVEAARPHVLAVESLKGKIARRKQWLAEALV
jgi:hypothetical protein